MAGIFLSYSREDASFAESLTRLLEQAGHDVWWDRNIGSGSEFSGEIEAALEKAEIVLVAWSKESVKSRWVRDEAAVGGDTGRLIPVSIDGSLPPMGFRQFHTLDLSGWKPGKKDPLSAELLGDIDRRVMAKGKSSPAPAAATLDPVGIAARRKPTWMMVAALLALVSLAGTTFFVLRVRYQKEDRTTKPTIALVSFAAPSSDPQLRDLSGQVRDSLSHALSQSGVPARLFDSMPANGSAAGDFLIAGEMGRSADKAVASVRLIEAAHGVTIYSTRFEAAPDEILDFPERIGAQMASFLSNGATLLTLDRRHPVDPAVMTELLSGQDVGDLQLYQTNKRVAAKAPDVPSAQVGVAFLTGFVLDQLPRGERPQALAEGRRAYDRALELAPDFGDTYAAWCLLHDDSQTIECEDNLRKGNRIDPDAPYLNTFLAGILAGVGRFDEAFDFARLSYAHDPYDAPKIKDMLRMLEASGDKDAARKLYQDGARWWPERRWLFLRSRIFGLADRGDFEGMRRVEQEVGVATVAPKYVPSTAIAAAVKSKSVPALRAACPLGDDFELMVRCMVAFSTLGDLDSAFAVADKLYPGRIGRTPAETEKIWLDDPAGSGPLRFVSSRALAAMRRDPRYLQLAQRTGLLGYWRSGRAPDFCRKDPEPVCPTLLAQH